MGKSYKSSLLYDFFVNGKKNNIIKVFICFVFFVIPIIATTYVLNLMIGDKWNTFQPQNNLFFACSILIYWSLSWLSCKLLLCELTDTNVGKSSYSNLSGFATIVGIIFLIFTAYNYTPSYGMIITICILFFIQVLVGVLKKKEITLSFSSIIVFISFTIIFLIHPNCNYEKYSKKVNDAIMLSQTKQYYAAIDSFNLLLEDKYFVNNYEDSLAKLALTEKNNAMENLNLPPQHGARPSVSVSSPTKTNEGIKYSVDFSNFTEKYFGENSIVLNDFTASIEIESITENKYIVYLKNIKGSSGKKNIYILSGAVKNSNGSSLSTPRSISFPHINMFERIIAIIMCIIFLIAPFLFAIKIWSRMK